MDIVEQIARAIHAARDGGSPKVRERFAADYRIAEAYRKDAKAALDCIEPEISRLRADLAEAQALIKEAREVIGPLKVYADLTLVDGIDGEIGEAFKDGLRVSIRTQCLRRAAAWVEKAAVPDV